MDVVLVQRTEHMHACSPQVHAAQQAKRLSDPSTAGDEAVAELFKSACPVLANIRFTINLSL
jgi:hypothetical protein